MSADKPLDTMQMVETWLTASRMLRFEIVAPFVLRSEKLSVDCIGFLPDFGSPCGMVIGATLPPDFETDRRLVECARQANLYCSFINAEAHAIYDEERIKETLRDWGFYGASATRPHWFLT